MVDLEIHLRHMTKSCIRNLGSSGGGRLVERGDEGGSNEDHEVDVYPVLSLDQVLSDGLGVKSD